MVVVVRLPRLSLGGIHESLLSLCTPHESTIIVVVSASVFLVMHYVASLGTVMTSSEVFSRNLPIIPCVSLEEGNIRH